MKVHLQQLNRLTNGIRGWCGRLFWSEEGNCLTMDWEGVTCETCLRAYTAFLKAYPND